MARLRAILSRPWAPVLALIPIINVTYIIFRFCTPINRHSKVPYWILGIILFAGFVLYRILPESLGWLVTHLILSGFAAAFIYKDRNAHSNTFQFDFKRILTYLPWILALLVMMWLVPILLSSRGISIPPNLSEKSRSALNAIVNDDQDSWEKLVHQGEGKYLNNIESFKERLLKNGISFENGYHFVPGRSKTQSTYSTDTGVCHCMEDYIAIGDEIFLLRVVWLDGNDADGFIGFDVIDCY